MRYLGYRALTGWLAGRPARARSRRSPSCTGASTTRPHRAGRRHPRPGRAGADAAGRPATSFRTDDIGRAQLDGVVGRRSSSPPGPGRSTPARRRSSATSWARWCSACPRSPGPTAVPGGRGRVESLTRRPAGPASRGACGRRVGRARPGAVGDRGSRQVALLAAPGWWRRWPPLPVPDRRYLRFRLQTAYGDPDQAPDAGRRRRVAALVQARCGRSARPRLKCLARRCRRGSLMPCCTEPPGPRWCTRASGSSQPDAGRDTGSTADVASAHPQRHVRAALRRVHPAGPAARPRRQGRAGARHRPGVPLRAGRFPEPSVVRLAYYVKVPYQARIALNRRAVFARDGHRCQYCGASAENIDHVIPRSRGGPHAWDNVVAACRPCNSRKRDRLLEESGMKLRRKPTRRGSAPGSWWPAAASGRTGSRTSGSPPPPFRPSGVSPPWRVARAVGARRPSSTPARPPWSTPIGAGPAARVAAS